MSEAPHSSLPVPSGAACSRHPDRAAALSCDRCGAFLCTEDEVAVGGRVYCSDCAARPEVDYLEAFRRRCWGKRTPGVWVIAVAALLVGCAFCAGLVSEIVDGNRRILVPIALIIAGAVAGVLLFVPTRWSRIAVFAFPLAPFAVSAWNGMFSYVHVYVLATLLIASVVLDPRIRLYFERDCSRAQLQRAWHRHEDNRIARAGFWLGVVAAALFLGATQGGTLPRSAKELLFRELWRPWFSVPLAVAALPSSVIGLLRVSPASHPPVGRRGQATAGLALGALALGGWIAVWLR